MQCCYCDNVMHLHSLLFVCSAASEHTNMDPGALWVLSTRREVRFHCGSFSFILLLLFWGNIAFVLSLLCLFCCSCFYSISSHVLIARPINTLWRALPIRASEISTKFTLIIVLVIGIFSLTKVEQIQEECRD